jgi:hypothetical protein
MLEQNNLHLFSNAMASGDLKELQRLWERGTVALKSSILRPTKNGTIFDLLAKKYYSVTTASDRKKYLEIVKWFWKLIIDINAKEEQFNGILHEGEKIKLYESFVEHFSIISASAFIDKSVKSPSPTLSNSSSTEPLRTPSPASLNSSSSSSSRSRTPPLGERNEDANNIAAKRKKEIKDVLQLGGKTLFVWGLTKLAPIVSDYIQQSGIQAIEYLTTTVTAYAEMIPGGTWLLSCLTTTNIIIAGAVILVLWKPPAIISNITNKVCDTVVAYGSAFYDIAKTWSFDVQDADNSRPIG